MKLNFLNEFTATDQSTSELSTDRFLLKIDPVSDLNCRRLASQS